MTIIDAIRRSGSRATNPNDSIGYGVPDLKKATLHLLKLGATSNAAISNCKTTITWSSKDVNTMKYEIERKNPGSATYVKVGEVFGTGSSFASHNYQFEDPVGGVNAGTISYRIRQVVDTSVAGFAADYIDTTTVSLATNCAVITGIGNVNSAEKIFVVPNPVHNKITLKMELAQSIKNLAIQIANNKGQVVGRYQTFAPGGVFSKEIDVSFLPKGNYYLLLFDGPKSLRTLEFVKL
jgi:hypothetical protein